MADAGRALVRYDPGNGQGRHCFVLVPGGAEQVACNSRTAGPRHAPSGAPPQLPAATFGPVASKAWPALSAVLHMHAPQTFLGVLSFFSGNSGNKCKKC